MSNQTVLLLGVGGENMTIDEVIEDLIYDAQCNRADLDIEWAERNEQLAKWLEELKALKSASELWEHNNNLAYKQGRIDAIDEFMKVMEEWDKRVGFIRDECAFFTISNIRDAAEQIKAR